jgi:hypothetical protein
VPAVQVVTTGTPLLRARVTDADLAAMAQDDAHLRALHAVGVRSIVVVPLRGRNELLGALALAFAESGRTYTERELVGRAPAGPYRPPVARPADARSLGPFGRPGRRDTRAHRR